MKSERKPEVLIITGPTGTGKSELAAKVAGRLSGGIISADSRKVYRGMDIGTAKPGPALPNGVAFYGLDRVDPTERYSAGRFAKEARLWISEIGGRGGVPVIVGGTGFFIRALLNPLAPEPEVDISRRDQLRRHLSGFSPELLRRWLTRLDPVRAAELRQEGGRQRLSRSLEVSLLSGRPHTWWLEWPPEAAAVAALVFVLNLPLPELYARLDRRFERMMEDGLIAEVGALLRRFPEDAAGFKTLGYAELIEHLHGRVALQRAVEEAQRATRRFARRQLTWFRHQLPDDAVWLSADEPSDRLVEAIVARWKARAPEGPEGPAGPEPPGSTSSTPIASSG